MDLAYFLSIKGVGRVHENSEHPITCTQYKNHLIFRVGQVDMLGLESKYDSVLEQDDSWVIK